MALRTLAISLTELPIRQAEKVGPAKAIRLYAVRQECVRLFQVDDQTHIVCVLRAFYGGEYYGALFHGENED